MELLDHFAGLAMQKIIADSDYDMTSKEQTQKVCAIALARKAYVLAQAMIEVRPELRVEIRQASDGRWVKEGDDG